MDEATPDGAFYVNARSKAIAYCYMTTSMTDETTGCVEERVELARPTGRERIRLTQFEESAWGTNEPRNRPVSYGREPLHKYLNTKSKHSDW